ncbi:MAG: zinc-binding alcohol dehydrogenase family protein [Lactobacillus sp.]|uniref:quinone oxidoreductase family protein n=1 Tax=Bombilactobacillus bombi TaxID=1303590 RepID=UPI0035E49DEB|nr:zinc-binding alcohol dehydrogenase family protein [Lactobacillus sp.]
MKAVIQSSFEGITALKLRDILEPHMSAMSVLIKNRYTPVIPWDWLSEEGQLQNFNPVKLPRIIGYSFGGIVEKVGALRNQKLLGKKVFGFNPQGTHTQLINSQIPPLLIEVPTKVSLEDATTIIGGADAALLAVKQSKIRPNDIVLVTGATGGVGSYLIQLLKLMKTTVIAFTRKENYSFAQNLGADYIIDFTQDIKHQLQLVPKPNKIIDTAGSVPLLDTISHNYEKLTIFSLSLPKYKPINSIQTFSFSNKSIGIKGYQQLLSMLENKQISASINQILPFQEVIQAQQIAKFRPSQGRILLEY